ncbi:MAG: TIGR04283 family arsenosugar biosynthesis glycosyltransferase [Gemmatimonadota bacterium]|nr:TIGR04283 family arsenosugar biosynthesis glycosyltransferase [Gemmatimonadota bacterium]
MTEPRLSVIIPALNEAIGLPLLLGDLRRLEDQGLEILVVDGGSTDETIARAEAGGATVLRTTPGRARQLSTGATAARGDWLLFLHADSRLGPVALERLAAALDRPRPFAVAVFRFAIDLPGGWKGFIERGQAIREVLFGLPYGDQGLLIRRESYEATGGYPDLPIMEDVALVRRLRRRHHIHRLRAPLLTSGRRYRERGVLRTWLEHTVLIFLYSVGVSPTQLAAWRNGPIVATR